MKKFTPLFILTILSLAVYVLLGASTSASALSLMEGVNAARGNDVPDTLFGDASIVTTVINTMLFIVGALAVVMIIFGGLRYVTSAGNSSAVTAAKNTIIYAIVGLIVAFLAFAAINFVLGSVTSGASGGQFPTSNL
jgi:ABC-type Na+ efflux pump permease subunit